MPAALEVVVALRSGVILGEEHGRWVARGAGVAVALGQPGRGVLDALQKLAGGGAGEGELSAGVLGSEGDLGLARLHAHLGRLADAGLIRLTLRAEGAALATAEPATRAHLLRSRPLDPAQPVRLSRFACCRREGAELLVESPLSRAVITLHDRRCGALLLDLAAPAAPRDLARDLPEEAARRLLGLLLDAGLLDAGSDDEDPALASWEPHDLWFHARSRKGRHDRPYGGTYRFLGQTAPLPAVKPPPPDPGLSLGRPDLASLEQRDLPFTRVLEGRRSARVHGAEPITLEALGELLYRAARVRRRFAGAREELSDRPYPGGGAMYELEIYPVIRRCAGIDAGLFHYDPAEHRLRRIREHDAEVAALLEDARASAGAAEIQVLLVIAARFQRVTWKYQSMAYALILKDTGVLYQTLCLVAEAMGLAACPLGGGDADRFARAAGTDYLAETSVGELILGSRTAPL